MPVITVTRGLLRLLFTIAFSVAVASTASPAEGQMDQPTLDWLQSILDRWEATCREKLRISPEPLPWMIFYDEAHAWHVRPEQELLPPYTRTSWELRFAGSQYPLFEVNNDGKLWVPGRDPLSTETRGVAMLYADESKPFFVLATPSLLAKSTGAVESAEFINFFATSALHELTHTRQLAEIMPVVKQLRSEHRFPESLDDNLIQTTFEGNEGYRRAYEQERGHLSKAILSEDPSVAKEEIVRALAVATARRQHFFASDYEGWSDMEDVFLSLEGPAMWVQFQAALELAPSGEPRIETLITLSRRTDAWSQEEGLALFLLLERFRPDWPSLFFTRSAPPSPFGVLRKAIEISPPNRTTP